jgi:hypothetical protein
MVKAQAKKSSQTCQKVGQDNVSPLAFDFYHTTETVSPKFNKKTRIIRFAFEIEALENVQGKRVFLVTITCSENKTKHPHS